MKTAGIFEEVGTISSHLSMKSHSTEDAYAEVRVVHTVFTDTSIALESNRGNGTRVKAEVAVPYLQMLL